MSTLQKNVQQAISDFDSIKKVIEQQPECGEIESGIPTRLYADILIDVISDIRTGYDYIVSGILDRSITDLNIPDTTTEIGLYAMRYSKLKSVVIPSTVKEIKSYAFQNCDELETLTIQNGCETLGISSFASCSKLKTVFLPNTLKTLSGTFLFQNDKALEFVTLEQGFDCDKLVLSMSTLYSVETIVSWFVALADRTGKEEYTLTIGASNLEKLTEEQKLIAYNKNWKLV